MKHIYKLNFIFLILVTTKVMGATVGATNDGVHLDPKNLNSKSVTPQSYCNQMQCINDCANPKTANLVACLIYEFTCGVPQYQDPGSFSNSKDRAAACRRDNPFVFVSFDVVPE